MLVDSKKIRQGFPIFNNNPALVYLDSAATSQKPQAVIDAVNDFYIHKNANIHRGIYQLADKATNAYEQARVTVKDFIKAKSEREIIFTGNTNQSINLVAYGWAKKFLKSGDIIILSEMEHHANLVPWLRLQAEIGVELFFLPIDKDYRLNYKKILDVDVKKIKLIALTYASNVLGTINPIEEIVIFLKKNKIDAKILIDAAQSIPHFPIDVQRLNVDFLAFSSHKMLGPSGVGVLWTRQELLQQMDPLFVGSHMIKKVTKETFTYADLPDTFEVGTGNLEGVVGLATAILYIENIGFENIITHEKEIIKYALERFKTVPYMKIYGSQNAENRLAIFSFGIKDAHPHDIAQIMDRLHICIRSGNHCTQPLMSVLGVPATARASFYLYNTKEDVDKLIEGIALVKKTLKI
ncbi:MAG TPA: cysteine desulfurase [Candidatus Saccharimonadales bacterium]|nr:cysteine desulfurase [Candidatus Saccharimonadales bacterium]